jgi:hypothetical protein
MKKTSEWTERKEFNPDFINKYDHFKGVMCGDPKCGGECCADGEAIYQLPHGFGDIGDGKFSVVAVKYQGWYGECEKCHKITLAWKTKKAVIKGLRVSNFNRSF